MTTPNTTLTPRQRVGQIKLYPAGDSRNYQYKWLCEELATELEAAQKESSHLSSLNDEQKRQLKEIFDTCSPYQRLDESVVSFVRRWRDQACDLRQQLADKTRECEAKDNLTETARENRQLRAENVELKKAVGHWTKDGKPATCGSHLYLFPNDDVSRPPMTLKIPEASHTCWYASPEDARTAIDAARKEQE